MFLLSWLVSARVCLWKLIRAASNLIKHGSRLSLTISCALATNKFLAPSSVPHINEVIPLYFLSFFRLICVTVTILSRKKPYDTHTKYIQIAHQFFCVLMHIANTFKAKSLSKMKLSNVNKSEQNEQKGKSLLLEQSSKVQKRHRFYFSIIVCHPLSSS